MKAWFPHGILYLKEKKAIQEQLSCHHAKLPMIESSCAEKCTTRGVEECLKIRIEITQNGK